MSVPTFRTGEEEVRFRRLCAHGASLIVPVVEAEQGGLDGGGTMRLNTAARVHLDHLRHRVTPETRRQRRYDLESFVAHVGGDVALRAVKRTHIEAWLAEQECATSTLRLRFLAVRMLFDEAEEEGWIHGRPYVGIRLPRMPRKQPRDLTREELLALGRSLPDARAHLIVALAVNEGLRRVEISRLELADIDLGAMLVRVVTAKGGAVDDHPLTEWTRDDYLMPWLRERGGRPGPLIVSYTTGRALTPHTIGALVAGWLRDAGVKASAYDGKSLHACRHTYARRLLDAGAEVEVVQQGLRHASLASTWTYLRNRKRVDDLRPFMGLRPPAA